MLIAVLQLAKYTYMRNFSYLQIWLLDLDSIDYALRSDSAKVP